MTPRPAEPVLGQPFQDKHEARPVEEQNLHPVTAAVAKGKYRRGKGIQRDRLLNQHRKAVDGGPEVNRFPMQVDLNVWGKLKHRAPLR